MQASQDSAGTSVLVLGGGGRDIDPPNNLLELTQHCVASRLTPSEKAVRIDLRPFRRAVEV